MYDDQLRAEAAELRAAGATLSQISRRLSVSRSTLREWHASGGRRKQRSACPRCDGVVLDETAYPALLGFYLGDGCVSRHARHFALRVSCDARLPGIVDDVVACITAVRPGGKVFRGRAPGAVVVTSNWMHWPCLFPQHGPGRKHERPIVLDDWQRAVVEAHPAAFLRGLFHSDGSRVRNWATRPVAGVLKRYDYPRWQFSNVSADIRELCCCPSSCLAGLPAEARGARRLREPAPTGAERRVVRLVSKPLDLVGVAWRQSSWNMVSVSRRDAVARLDELIGLKQ